MKIFNKNEWKKVKLGDVFDLQMGKTPLRENKLYWDKGEYHWISISDMNFSEKYISSTKEKITELAVKKSGIKIIPKNTVIMSFKLSIGKVKIVNEDIYSNEAIMAFIPKTNNFIDENFLYYSLKGVRWNEGINKAVKGLTLNKALISQKEIFLPNLAIQKEIASNLDSIADFLDLRRKQLNYLKELNKSLFTTMFGDIEKKFEYHKLSNICDVRDGTHDSPEYITTDKRFPLITSKNLKGDKIDFSEVNFISEADFNKINVRSKVDIGDILMPMIGTIGNPIIVKINKKFSIKNLALIKFKNSQIINTFLKFLLLSDYFNLIISQKNKGGTQKFLSLSDIRNFLIPVPPIELQNKFAERIEKIEKLKFEIEKSIETAQNLYDSLISKYFDN
jgi:type I restriction-modification enzyme, S subunit